MSCLNCKQISGTLLDVQRLYSAWVTVKLLMRQPPEEFSSLQHGRWLWLQWSSFCRMDNINPVWWRVLDFFSKDGCDFALLIHMEKQTLQWEGCGFFNARSVVSNGQVQRYHENNEMATGQRPPCQMLDFLFLFYFQLSAKSTVCQWSFPLLTSRQPVIFTGS